jgi:hypothetical protein
MNLATTNSFLNSVSHKGRSAVPIKSVKFYEPYHYNFLGSGVYDKLINSHIGGLTKLRQILPQRITFLSPKRGLLQYVHTERMEEQIQSD